MGDVNTALDRLEAYECPTCGGTREKKQTIGDMWKVYPGWMPHPDYPPPPLPAEPCPDCEGMESSIATVRAELQRLTEELANARVLIDEEWPSQVAGLEAAEARVRALQDGLRRVLDEAPYLDGPEKELIRALLADSEATT